jgi:hypothetical protein
LYRKPEQRKSLFPALCRERGIKQLYARFSAGGLHLTLDSSTCCLKNSIIILPQTRGVVKRFFEFSKIFSVIHQDDRKNFKASN